MSTNGTDHSPQHEPDANILEHFLYFPEQSKAEEAAKRLRAKGWTASVSLSPGSTEWLVFATEYWPKDEQFDETFRELERLAEELGGRYDGWGGPA